MSSILNAMLLLSCLSHFKASASVTTIFQLEASKANEGFDPVGTWRVVTSHGARGVPVRRGNIGVSNVWAGTPCCETWRHDGWTKLNQEEALRQNPPLEVDTFEPAKSNPVTKPSASYKQSSEGVWRGTMDLDSRVRLTFVPPGSGRASLAIYLCETEEIRDDHCVSVVVTGSSSNGKTLRYRTKRPSTYRSAMTGSQRLTSNSPPEYILSEEYSVGEGWQSNNSYHFRIERTVKSDLHVELDNGDPSQRNEVSVRGDVTYNKVMVSLLPDNSDAARELRLTDDTFWQGDIFPGDNITVSFAPNSNNIGHLGFALCEDQFRDHCSAIVIDGIEADKLVRSDPAYWIAGSEEAHTAVPDSSKNGRWGKSSLKLMLSRDYNGTVVITVDGVVKHFWSVSSEKQYLIVGTYHNEGGFSVHTNPRNITASVWRLDKDKGELRSPPLPKWFSEGDMCVSVAARVSQGAEIVMSVQRVGDDSSSKVFETLKSGNSSQWIRKRIMVSASTNLQVNKVQIVLTARQHAQTRTPVLVQWAAGCDPALQHSDEVLIKEFVPLFSLKDTVGFRSTGRPDSFFGETVLRARHKVCQNEGLLGTDGKCLCRPGFKGTLCEKGCGPNRFGEDCENKCSGEFSSRKCRGMLLCTANMPCDCGPGLKGPHCDQPCDHGEYGVGCRQKCGQCAHGGICDPYTGVCSKGCEGTLLPPFCKTVCGRSSAVVRLVGNGGLARQVENPWQAGIYRYESSHEKLPSNDTRRIPTQICSGTLISTRIVISAAHCFWDNLRDKQLPTEKFSVGFAKTKRDWNAKEEFPHRVQKRDVWDINVHPRYRDIQGYFGYDISIITLATPIQHTDFVIPACFDQVGKYEEDLRAGLVGRFAGWSRPDGKDQLEDITEGELSYIPSEDCLKAVRESFWPYVSIEDKFCAGAENGAYITRGESGGGLIFQQSGSWYLRGIASVGQIDAKSLAGYTNTSFHRDWIVGWMQRDDLLQAYKEADFKLR